MYRQHLRIAGPTLKDDAAIPLGFLSAPSTLLSVWLQNYRFRCFLLFSFSPFPFFSGKAKQKVAEYAEIFRETFKNPLPNAEKCVII